jgi:transposase
MGTIFCGIDFHKNTSTLCALREDGSDLEKVTTIRTENLGTYLSNRRDWKVVIEASGGVNPTVRKLREMGMDVSIINPNNFRACLGSGKKTDDRDARGLAERLRLGKNPTVHLKSPYCQKIKSLEVAREEVVNSRVSLGSHIRGMLRELGVSFPAGKEEFIDQIPGILNGLQDGHFKNILSAKKLRFDELLREEESIANILEEYTKDDAKIALLKTIPGVGLHGACMLRAVSDELSHFESAKQFASYLGLVPRVHASANKCMMGSITRSGSEITRRYLIHGARACLRYLPEKDAMLEWGTKTSERIGKNKGTVALAHRMARVAFAMMRDDSPYRGRKKKKATTLSGSKMLKKAS